ncbi:uncharacterized protein Z520_02241 [Fonsecaea multimorphosa CBS 102226]|uniref:Cryptic loci regulator 2 N-terminal domain-containing protein n=1 Tax=Fonsecaea multimorphosa CBS 102226 TaxID=1442371 RepID=A0A0D2K7R8_9EURO|nr:uncharacterized protein Z520_02241 [Fonsecaea multimorphosa CBS 102226]KIY02103.1 hypothetical protein Z520_02241 [Fonsecaea multimorphosa CBS 102226]OAL29303.1 hypothetical protein AYO22_02197 [Fonsecaea multimorphosa]
MSGKYAAHPDPQWEIIGRRGHWQVLPIKPYSDGDQRTWPPKPYRPSSEERHLVNLAKVWSEKMGIQRLGFEYYLDKLPLGYAVFEIDQHGKTGVAYKRLFGHRSGKYYDSILRFQPHFLWLMSGMQGICECILCGNHKAEPIKRRIRHPAESILVTREQRATLDPFKSEPSSRSDSVASRATGAISARPQRHIKAVGAPYALDAEGTEDVFKDQLKRLEANKGGKTGIEDDIREPNSIDWRAEHSWTTQSVHDWPGVDHVQRSLTLIEHQHAFVPRVGELVLFCPIFLHEHYLMLDEKTQEYKFYSFEQKCFHGSPVWRGGVIAAVPSAIATDGPVDFPDIQDLPSKQTNLNTGGFRVETFPDPNDEEDKSMSKQYRYLPLRNIRPLSHWQMLLRGIPRTEWHPSIEYALTCMTSISLLEKWYFKGDWPYATIRCKGIYIGPELITVGDAVRIAPRQKAKGCSDVLVVESIRLHLDDIKPEHVSPDSPLLSTRSYITLVGRGYTTDRSRHYQLQAADANSQPSGAQAVPQDEVKTVFRPVGSAIYGHWYPLHAPHHRYEISHDQILGRLYEAAAVQLWTGLLQRKRANGDKDDIKPSLDYDLKGIQEGRVYATQADERLAEAKEGSVLWYWADTRAEALDLQTVNGLEVGKYDKTRDKDTLELWRTHLKILNGQQFSLDTIASQYTSNFPDSEQSGNRRGRPTGSKVIEGKLYKPGDPGYDDIIGGAVLELQSTPSKHKGSQLAGAALVSTDEEDDDEEVSGDGGEDWYDTVEASAESQTIEEGRSVPNQKKPKTKAEIMASAVEDEDISEDEDWYNDHIPLVRGGTEETEGGDYDPRAEMDD